MMSSTCFKTEGSSSGRQSYIQVWYSVFYMHQYKLSHPDDEPSGLKHVEDIIN
jgi:hypothetical protein